MDPVKQVSVFSFLFFSSSGEYRQEARLIESTFEHGISARSHRKVVELRVDRSPRGVVEPGTLVEREEDHGKTVLHRTRSTKMSLCRE